jgi:hypothetical protein
MCSTIPMASAEASSRPAWPIRCVTVNERLDFARHLARLTDTEQAALRRAAVWYFKRHARLIADEVDDRSARATAQREDFLELYAALRRLGVPIALPDELHVRTSV